MECVLENTTVHYEVYGEGRPILMLHGWPSDHHSMLNMMEPIFKKRDGWKRIYIDLPGMGKTPGKDELAHQDHILDILLNFIDKVVPGQRFITAGYSYGGYLARGLIHRRSNMMDGLYLLAPVIRPHHEDRSLPSHTVLVEDHTVTSMLKPEEEELFVHVAVVQSQKLLEILRNIISPARELADHDFLTKLSDNYSFSFDVDSLEKPFPGPMLIIMGRQDSICGYRDAWEILENFPRGSFAVLDRAGHALAIDQEELSHLLVDEWLNRVEEYINSTD